MRTLFWTDDKPLEELLQQISKPSSHFKFWVKGLFLAEKGKQILENMLHGLIKGGLAQNRQDGLEHLNELCRTQQNSNLAIACADLLGKNHTRPFRELEKLISRSKPETDIDFLRFFGIVSHQAIHDLVTGKIPDFARSREVVGLDVSLLAEPADNLFGTDREYRQLTLFSPQETSPEILYFKHILPGNQISAALESKIFVLWKKMAGNITGTNNWTEAYVATAQMTHELEALLFPIFGPYINKLKQDDGAYTKYLFTLTILSWATILSIAPKKRILFKEIPVLSAHHGLNGGRIDALELTAIDGATPKKWQTNVLREMTDGRFNSIGHLITELEKKFGKNLSFRVIDWKFAVGDGVENSVIFKASDIEEPFAKHAAQIRRYITLGNLDFYLARKNLGKKKIWDKNSPIKSAQLIYILPTSKPVIHEIEMDLAEQENFFQNDIIGKLNRGHRLAKMRNLNNLLVGNIVGSIKNNGQNLDKPNGNGKNKKDSQPALLEPDQTSQIETVISQYRNFVDEHKIIERVGTSHGKPTYIMHLNNLIKSPVSGNFDASHNGGFISCLMPEHEDSTPSLHIDLSHGLWKCFGCGVYGFFSHDSTLDFDAKITFTGKVAREFKKGIKLAIPDEHHKIMLAAQRILNLQFRRSLGEAYVRQRSINPDLAYDLGAGYGNDKFINVFLDEYDYDQLIHYGFVGISSKVSSEAGICPVLKKRGMKLEQMKREIEGKWGLPYSVLAKRLTFPLMLEGRYTSFYGRATWTNCAERSKHRKLSTKQTGIPHGAFNAGILQSDAEELIVTEGVFDALSLMQLGHKNTLAIIGVSNSVTIESLARTGKNFAIAFDHDKNQTGQTNTAKIIEQLQKMGHKGSVQDFTQKFIGANPDFLELGCKDYNEYLNAKTKTA